MKTWKVGKTTTRQEEDKTIKAAAQAQRTISGGGGGGGVRPTRASAAVPPSITNLRAELVADLDVIAPQIRGLHYLVQINVFPDLVSEESSRIVDRERRRDLIQNVITALDALVADGYPDLLPDQIQPQLFSELQGELSDIQAAANIFQQVVAEHLQINFSPPVPKE